MQVHRFDYHLGRCVVSLSKTLHPSCLVLVKPRKSSQNDWKSVDRDVKPQTNKQTVQPEHLFSLLKALAVLSMSS